MRLPLSLKGLSDCGAIPPRELRSHLLPLWLMPARFLVHKTDDSTNLTNAVASRAQLKDPAIASMLLRYGTGAEAGDER